MKEYLVVLEDQRINHLVHTIGMHANDMDDCRRKIENNLGRENFKISSIEEVTGIIHKFIEEMSYMGSPSQADLVTEIKEK